MLEGKKILVGVCGSIAAYKAAYLVRLLVQSGADVRVMMSPGAQDFITPLTLATLSRNRIYSDFTENKEAGTWTNHVELGLWADLIVLAPLSANTLAKLAHGQSDSFLVTTVMSSRCPVMAAPAMDHDMFLYPGTMENLSKLRSFGHLVLTGTEGELASGLSGKGRMSEPEDIFTAIVRHFHPELPLEGMRFLVTAGPTYEKIDPVRFIGNFSSGKMGFAIAEELARLGANVELIAGPGREVVSHPLIRRTNVISAEEMYRACLNAWPTCDGGVLAAAVADYRPARVASTKIKKKDASLTIELESTPDIAAHLGASKGPTQLLVGFALETNDEEANALGKLQRKNFDMIVLNSLRDEGAGFGGDTNKITVFWPDNNSLSFGLKTKTAVAADIVQEIVKLTHR